MSAYSVKGKYGRMDVYNYIYEQEACEVVSHAMHRGIFSAIKLFLLL